MKYRSRFEIAADILNVTLAGKASKRKLMYSSYISSAQINEYLDFLLKGELIMVDGDKHVYSLTEKGMRFLQFYEDLRKLIPFQEPALTQAM
jgi:predicted transcriptional regulator